MIRFEPSDEYEEFNTKKLCDLIIEKLKKQTNDDKWRWYIVKEGLKLNTFSACRAFSTLLASLHITDTPLKNLSELKNTKYIKPFAYLMQEEMKNNLMNCKVKIEKVTSKRMPRKADITTQLYNSVKI